MARRLSVQTLSVLHALGDDPGRWRYGYELGQEVELKAGSLYPILMRMYERGQLESSWEADPPAGRPPRHLYRLTAAGARLASEQPIETATAQPRGATTVPAGRRKATRRPAQGSARIARLGVAW